MCHSEKHITDLWHQQAGRPFLPMWQRGPRQVRFAKFWIKLGPTPGLQQIPLRYIGGKQYISPRNQLPALSQIFSKCWRQAMCNLYKLIVIT